MYKLRQLICTIPSNTASAERKFSALKRISSCFRFSQHQERVSGLSEAKTISLLLCCCCFFKSIFLAAKVLTEYNNNNNNNAGLSTSTRPGESRSFALKSSHKLYTRTRQHISHAA